MSLDETGCVPHLLPVIHNAGIVCGLHAAHSVGACFALSAPNAEGLMTLARFGGLTHLLMSPPIAQEIISDRQLREALRTLRVVIYVNGSPPPDVIAEFETGDCVVGRMFGQGEGLCMITPLDGPPEIRHGTLGAPLSAFDEVRVYAPETEDLVPLGESGELCCRGPYTIRGYYRAPERNAEAFTSDGFYRSGDIVRAVMHESGGGPYYRLEDRLKDLINRGGEKVNALEIEELLVAHPAIARASVVAMPDKRLGERACAFIVPAPGARGPDKEEIQEFLRERRGRQVQVAGAHRD